MKLDLSKRGDYGVRAMLALTRAGRQLRTSQSIATETHVPVHFLPQIMGDLARAGLVTSLPGRHGGYRLSRDPATISLLDVIEAIEGDARRHMCVLRGGPCRVDGRCDVHDIFSAAQAAVLGRFESASLASVAGEPAAIDPA
ncbi:MAG: RrF2 family transcriptional regulator [Candidatus Limnocylindrales bacterium]